MSLGELSFILEKLPLHLTDNLLSAFSVRKATGEMTIPIYSIFPSQKVFHALKNGQRPPVRGVTPPSLGSMLASWEHFLRPNHIEEGAS